MKDMPLNKLFWRSSSRYARTNTRAPLTFTSPQGLLLVLDPAALLVLLCGAGWEGSRRFRDPPSQPAPNSSTTVPALTWILGTRTLMAAEQILSARHPRSQDVRSSSSRLIQLEMPPRSMATCMVDLIMLIPILNMLIPGAFCSQLGV